MGRLSADRWAGSVVIVPAMFLLLLLNQWSVHFGQVLGKTLHVPLELPHIHEVQDVPVLVLLQEAPTVAPSFRLFRALLAGVSAFGDMLV